jgi:hypothetical protein
MIVPPLSRIFLCAASWSALLCAAKTQTPSVPPTNYEESRIGPLTLPDPLRLEDGNRVSGAEEWTRKRRPEILKLYEDHVYGRPPAEWGPVVFTVEGTKGDALENTATRTLIRVTLKDHPAWKGVQILLYVPKKRTGKVPCFLGLNFRANHGVTRETDIPINPQWLSDSRRKTPSGNTDPESSRGLEHSRWIPENLMVEGVALATAYYGDLEPDHAEGWKSGVRAALSPRGAETEWQPGEWGASGAWAWGLSRILDYVQTVPEIDGSRCAVVGHSRLGKTALWAGARDERFSVVLSNNSGEGGAALMRRNFGETVAAITKNFPHWFAPRFRTYAQNESACPVDQHELVALAAPRPVAIGSASEDRWADPKGEFLSAVHAGPVYALFGKTGISESEMPAPGKGVGDRVGYHMRAGPHDITAEDWGFYLRFCRRHWGL